MLRYTLKRVLQAIPVLLIVVTVTFFLVRMAPGGPFDSEKNVPAEILENLNARYHLNDPLYVQFFDYLKDAFDVLYAEGDPDGLDRPKMLSIGLHCRLVGRPARAAALARFLDYVQGHERVWVARRIDIARHWKSVHPYREAT